MLGGGIYLITRGLMIGPRWFQVLSISLGPAVVVGAMLAHPDGPFLRAPRRVALAPLIPWLPLAPVLLVGVLGWFGVEFLRRQPGSRALVEHPWVPWLIRLSLTVIFALSLTELVKNVAALT